VVESIICALLEILCAFQQWKIVKICWDLTKLQLTTKWFHFFSGHGVYYKLPVLSAVNFYYVTVTCESCWSVFLQGNNGVPVWQNCLFDWCVLICRLKHANIVQLLDVYEDKAFKYLVMELWVFISVVDIKVSSIYYAIFSVTVSAYIRDVKFKYFSSLWLMWSCGHCCIMFYFCANNEIIVSIVKIDSLIYSKVTWFAVQLWTAD